MHTKKIHIHFQILNISFGLQDVVGLIKSSLLKKPYKFFRWLKWAGKENNILSKESKQQQCCELIQREERRDHVLRECLSEQSIEILNKLPNLGRPPRILEGKKHADCNGGRVFLPGEAVSQRQFLCN